jgi:phenylacetic acid degradation operon negative regulatory protein
LNDPLRTRSVGSPAARSVLLTILGEYVLEREAVWQETLVAALTSMAFTEQAARQAIARSTRDGWLSAVRHGRRSRMSLTPQTRELLRTGADRIYGFGAPWGWDGRWLLIAVRVPERRRELRHEVRTRLSWAGFGSLGGGLWVSAHADREQEVDAAVGDDADAVVFSFTATAGSLADSARVVEEAWDLAGVEAAYRSFIADFRHESAKSDESAFRAQTWLVHAWRKFPFLDPNVPAELLPDGWPRDQAYELFRRRHEAWSGPAERFIDRLERASGSIAA